MARPSTSLDLNRMAHLYASGLTLDEVAAKMGVGKGSTISKTLKSAGIARRPPGTRPSTIELEVLLSLRSAGMSVPQIAEAVGSNRNTIYSRLRNHQLRHVPHRPEPDDQDEQPMRGVMRTIDPVLAAELYQSGMTLQQVADAMGFTAGGIQLRLKQAGVPRRKRVRHPKPVDPLTVQRRNEMLAERLAAARVKREKGAAARRRVEAAAAALQSVKVKGEVARTAREELRAECRAAAAAGAGYTAIALAAGVASSTAVHWITD